MSIKEEEIPESRFFPGFVEHLADFGMLGT